MEWVSRRDLSPYLMGAELRATQVLVDGYLDRWLPNVDFTSTELTSTGCVGCSSWSAVALRLRIAY